MKDRLLRFAGELWGWLEKLFNFKDPLHNFNWKLLSVCIAAFLWLAINNSHDPVVSRQFSDIPVRLLHTETQTEEDRICTVLDDSDVVSTVTVIANRSVIESLSAENIVATADLNSASPEGLIPITFSVNRYSDSVESVRGSTDTVRVSIEERRSAVFMLETETTGTVAEGYLLSTVSAEQNQIRVTGPLSVVESIRRAAVVLDVNDATGNINTNLDIRLYDADDREISMSSSLTANIERVMVRAEILPTKSVPIVCGISGAPAQGYQASEEIDIVPGTLTIAARRSVLEEINSIEVPGEMLNINGLKSSLNKVIDARELLPEGVILADPEHEGTIRIRVEIIRGANLESPSDQEQKKDADGEE